MDKNIVKFIIDIIVIIIIFLTLKTGEILFCFEMVVVISLAYIISKIIITPEWNDEGFENKKWTA